MFRTEFAEAAPARLLDGATARAPMVPPAGRGRRAVHFDWDPVAPWSARRRSPGAVLWRAAVLGAAAALTAALWLGAAGESARHRVDVEGAAAQRAPA